VTELSGLVVVDKPSGLTSHDVVSRLRRILGTRRVGHAGTLDPMATGMLVVGLGRATRLLGHLAKTDKDYEATVRLGLTTTTDDADGEVTGEVDASGVDDAALAGALRRFLGDIDQVPSAVSAVKVAGRRAYALARAGEPVELAARRVHISALELVARRGDEFDLRVTCSTGTYVRALARDLGAALGVGAHLTALRRTRVGGFGLDRARTLDELEAAFDPTPMAEAVAAAFPRRDVEADEARRLAHGQALAAVGLGPGPVGVFGPDGQVIALVEERGELAKPIAVFSVGC
jgi:tRNA pseudouridine55 synthase